MRPLHILLIEDDSDSGDAMSLLLRSEGHRVDWAATGGEALEVYRSARDPFDLIMLDLMLPDLDGSSLAQQLTSVAGLPPVVIHTAASSSQAEAAARHIGAAAILRKPTDWQRMRQFLDQCGLARPKNGGEGSNRGRQVRSGSSK
jgi:two-component system, OmpR family, response regulator